MNCCYCGGAIGVDIHDNRDGTFQHYSKIDCADVLRIERTALKAERDAAILRASEDREKWRGVLAMAELAMAAHPCNVDQCSCRELRARFSEERNDETVTLCSGVINPYVSAVLCKLPSGHTGSHVHTIKWENAH